MLRCMPDCFKNPRIGSAPADVAVHRLNDLIVTWFRDSAKQGSCGDDHARRAVAALERALFNEGLLNGGETAAVCQALDGYDTRAGRS